MNEPPANITADQIILRRAEMWADQLIRAYGTPAYAAEFRKTIERVVSGAENLEHIPDRFNALLHVLVGAAYRSAPHPLR